MTFYKTFNLDISDAQVRKAVAGKPINITAAQLNGSGTTLSIHPEVHRKLSAAKRRGTGTRIQISPEALRITANREGGSIWSWVKNQLWPAIKPAVSQALDAAVQPVATALGPYGMAAPLGRSVIRNLTGVGMGKKKLVKGSPEARAHMQALRSKRKGASFRL